MLRWLPPILLAVVLVLGVNLLQKPKPLPDYGEVPQFTLTSTSGKEFSSSELKDKTWIVNFFFSRCSMICPAVNGRISALARKHPGNSSFHVVSITIDPDNDSPSVLSEYSERFAANPALSHFLTWHFLTGPTDVINRLTQDVFKLGSFDDKELHSTRVILVDSNMRIRGFYRGDENEGMEILNQDLENLLAR